MSPFGSQPMNRTLTDTRKRTWAEASGHNRKSKKVPKVRNKTRLLPATKNAPQAMNSTPFVRQYGIDIIRSICMLLARGAIISMILVIFVLPALLMLCDGIIRHTTLGMITKSAKEEATE